MLAEEGRQPRAVIGVGGAGTLGADQPVGLVDADMIFVAEHRDREINLLGCLGVGALPTLALLYLIDQRASRSFCRGLASFQSCGTQPSLIVAFSASVLRCLGAGTTVASMICLPIARCSRSLRAASTRAKRLSIERLTLVTRDRRDDEAFRKVQAGGGADWAAAGCAAPGAVGGVADTGGLISTVSSIRSSAFCVSA